MGIRKVQIGEIIPMMTEEFEKGFEACIAKNKHRREPYFILFTADWYSNDAQLRTTFTPFGARPPKMLNTMCWRIDNKTGEARELWVLPKDAPVQPTKSDGVVESIAEGSKRMPLIYG